HFRLGGGKRKAPPGGGAPCGTLGVAETVRGGVVVWPGTESAEHVVRMNDVSSTILYARQTLHHSTIRRRGRLFSRENRFTRFFSARRPRTTPHEPQRRPFRGRPLADRPETVTLVQGRVPRVGVLQIRQFSFLIAAADDVAQQGRA